MKDRFHLTFPPERITAPVMCEVAKKFDVTFSIRRASVEAAGGWMDLQLEGDDDVIENVVRYIQESGVRIDPIEGDIIAG
ncbi:MAG TPA: NIL domain-containing protein [Abditibacteriaceae bacterium]|jgi:ABC-type methionine transport system ATPase subunit